MNEGSGRPEPFCWVSQDACSGGRVGPISRTGGTGMRLGCGVAGWRGVPIWRVGLSALLRSFPHGRGYLALRTMEMLVPRGIGRDWHPDSGFIVDSVLPSGARRRMHCIVSRLHGGRCVGIPDPPVNDESTRYANPHRPPPPRCCAGGLTARLPQCLSTIRRVHRA